MRVPKFDNTPPKARLSLQALLHAARGIETPRLVRKWSLMMAGFAAAMALLAMMALLMLLPTKEYVPYFLVQGPDGSVERSTQVAQRFEVTDVQLIYFGAQFVRKLLTIDEQLRFNLPAAYEMTRGAAVTQWRQFVLETDRPQVRLASNPKLRRIIELEGAPQIVRASAASSSGALIFFAQERTVTGDDRPQTRRIKVTLDFVLYPPQDIKSIEKNPIGFYVTGFRYEVIG
ncbi:MAG: type IV secretion system protein [Rhodocyclaceae bacterium]|nr:type IV secretion system protein [Rhodocyclaceae bacterium]